MRVSDVLRVKGTDVTTVDEATPVAEVISLLTRHRIGAVLVTTARDVAGAPIDPLDPDADAAATDGDGPNHVIGILSERDIVWHLAGGGLDPMAPAAAVMTPVLHTCQPDDPVESVMAKMTEHRVRHVPVLVGGALVGVVSIGDVVKHRLDELEFERAQLARYITDSV